VVDEWNKLGISPIQKITAKSKRGQMLKARIREYGIDGVIRAICNVSESTFLKGGSGSGWTITFDWFVKPNNFPKVLEGNYADRHTSTADIGGSNKSNKFNKFNDCQRNDYDFDALERSLLANGGGTAKGED
jgi:hypothetical protein